MSRGRGIKLGSVIRQLCPRCHQGRIFSHWFRMNKRCAACGYRFEREPGYFMGAMYFSYALAVPAYTLLVLLARRLLPAVSETWAFAAALPLFLLLVPPIFRISRAIWMHFDRALDREDPE